MSIGLFIYGALNLFMVVRSSKTQLLFWSIYTAVLTGRNTDLSRPSACL